MELKDFKWQTTPRFTVSGNKEELTTFIELAKTKGYTIDDMVLNDEDKLIVHLTHISKYSTVSNDSIKELLISNLLNLYLDTHYKFVQYMLNDDFITYEWISPNGIYPVIVSNKQVLIQGFIVKNEDIKNLINIFNSKLNSLGPWDIILDKTINCLIIGCGTYSYNDCEKLIQFMN